MGPGLAWPGRAGPLAPPGIALRWSKGAGCARGHAGAGMACVDCCGVACRRRPRLPLAPTQAPAAEPEPTGGCLAWALPPGQQLPASHAAVASESLGGRSRSTSSRLISLVDKRGTSARDQADWHQT